MPKWIWLIVLVIAAAAIYYGWLAIQPEELPEGFASSNGRIEAVEIDVAAKTPGRVAEILVDEGDFVAAGQVLARMDTAVLQAQLREAEAQLRQARSRVEVARNNVIQRKSQKAAAVALVAQREAERTYASKSLARAERVAERDAAALSAQDVDQYRANFYRAEAALNAARADVAAADAAIATAESDVIGAEAAVEAAEATIERIKADIADCELKSTRDGRVQYRIAQPGEVLAAGGRVLNLLDLADVYMTFFLPTAQAGRVKLGSDVRLVLDAAPQYVIPAKVTFVADVAQFTPKTVETAEERQKLMFRIKAHIDPDLLREHIRSVKTGLPGVAYVQLDEDAPWPEKLKVRVPTDPSRKRRQPRSAL